MIFYKIFCSFVNVNTLFPGTEELLLCINMNVTRILKAIPVLCSRKFCDNFLLLTIKIYLTKSILQILYFLSTQTIFSF